MTWTLSAVVLLLLAAGSLWMTQPLFLHGAAREGRCGAGCLPARAPGPESSSGVFIRATSAIPTISRARRVSSSRNSDGPERRSPSRPSKLEGPTYANVIASLGPETKDVVVVGAHYDVAGEMPGGRRQRERGGRPPGARRTCSPSRSCPTVLSSPRMRSRRCPSFRLLRWEARFTPARWRTPEMQVRAMLCLEMIGCFSDEPGSQRFPFGWLRLFYPGRGNFIAVVGNLGGAGIVRRVKRSMREGVRPARPFDQRARVRSRRRPFGSPRASGGAATRP